MQILSPKPLPQLRSGKLRKLPVVVKVAVLVVVLVVVAMPLLAIAVVRGEGGAPFQRSKGALDHLRPSKVRLLILPLSTNSTVAIPPWPPTYYHQNDVC